VWSLQLRVRNYCNAWGAFRYGVKPELYALSSISNIAVFIAIFILYLIIREDKKGIAV